jgi:hypothetical protein
VRQVGEGLSPTLDAGLFLTQNGPFVKSNTLDATLDAQSEHLSVKLAPLIIRRTSAKHV